MFLNCFLITAGKLILAKGLTGVKSVMSDSRADSWEGQYSCNDVIVFKSGKQLLPVYVLHYHWIAYCYTCNWLFSWAVIIRSIVRLVFLLNSDSKISVNCPKSIFLFSYVLHGSMSGANKHSTSRRQKKWSLLYFAYFNEIQKRSLFALFWAHVTLPLTSRKTALQSPYL